MALFQKIIIRKKNKKEVETKWKKIAFIDACLAKLAACNNYCPDIKDIIFIIVEIIINVKKEFVRVCQKLR